MKTFLLLAVLLAFSMLQCRADEAVKTNLICIPVECAGGPVMLIMDKEGLWIHLKGDQKNFCSWKQLLDYQEEINPPVDLHDGAVPGALFTERDDAG